MSADTYLDTADAMTLLDLIVAEWTSDPSSVAYFDARVIARATVLVREWRTGTAPARDETHPLIAATAATVAESLANHFAAAGIPMPRETRIKLDTLIAAVVEAVLEGVVLPTIDDCPHGPGCGHPPPTADTAAEDAVAAFTAAEDEEDFAGATRDWYVVEMMLEQGGSFVQALGAAFRRADPQNTARLRAAFPEYWDKYAAIAATWGKR